MSTVIVRFPPLLLAVTVLQLAVLPEFRVAGVAGDALLMLTIAAGIAAGPERGAVVGFVTGFVSDLFLQTPFGLSALVYSITGYAVGSFGASILRSAWWIPVLTALVASAAGVLGFAVAGTVLGQPHLITGRLVRITIVVALVNGILAWPFVRLSRWGLAVSRAREPMLR